MGGSTNTVLHLLAVAHEAEVDFKMDDIDMLSRKAPCLCKVAPNTQKYHIQDVNRAGGIIAIMDELAKGGLIDTSVRRVDGMSLAEAINEYSITSPNVSEKQLRNIRAQPEINSISYLVHKVCTIRNWIRTVQTDVSVTWNMLTVKTADWPY